MKEDYLWDKTGSDPAIEKLETALSVFRCEKNAPPAVPAKVLPFVKKDASRKGFPILRAIAACLAVTSISLGVWLFVSNAGREVAGGVQQEPLIKPEAARPITPLSESQPTTKPKTDDEPVIKKTLYIEPKSSAKSALLIKSSAKNAGRNKFSNRKLKNIEKVIRLTEEEKYAYEQLMLALSITSKKLKLVKEKIDGEENHAVVIQTAN